MNRSVFLSSLTVGRCFKVVKLPQEDGDEGASANTSSNKMNQGMMMMTPDGAWKVTGTTDAGVTAESAAGTTETFPAEAVVVEIPRQGFDRLVQRGRG